MSHRTGWPLAVAVALIATVAFGMGSDHPAGRSVGGSSSWPDGLTDLVNTDARVHGYFVNWEDVFFFHSDAATLNRFLTGWGKLKDTSRIVELHGGHLEVKSPWDQAPRDIQANWQLYTSPFAREQVRQGAITPGPFITRLSIWCDERLNPATLHMPADAKVTINADIVAMFAPPRKPLAEGEADRLLERKQMQADCAVLFAKLDSAKLAAGYPKAIADLLSGERASQSNALRVLSATGDPAAVPWIALLLRADDARMRIDASLALDRIVEKWALQRRDPAIGHRVALLPLKEGELDLKPLAWIVRFMLDQPDDGNTHAYAATMIRYLELREFAPQLRTLLKSRHPAVSNKAKWALESLDLAAGTADDCR